MSDRENADLVAGDLVEHVVWEAPDGKAAPTPTKPRADFRVLQDTRSGPLKFGDERFAELALAI